MSVIALILLVALLIPIMGIVLDSPIGRALGRRLEGPPPTSPAVGRIEPEGRGPRGRGRGAQSYRSGAPGRECLSPPPARGSIQPLQPATRPRFLSARPSPGARPAVMVAAGILASRISAWSGIASSHTTSARRTPPMRSTRRSGSRTFSRTCSGKGCCPPPSSRSTPAYEHAETRWRRGASPPRWRRSSRW